MTARIVLWAFIGLAVFGGSLGWASAIATSNTTPDVSKLSMAGRIDIRDIRDEGLMALVGLALIGIGVATRRSA